MRQANNKKAKKHRKVSYRVFRQAKQRFHGVHLPQCRCCPNKLRMGYDGIDLSNIGKNPAGSPFLRDADSNVIRYILHELWLQTSKRQVSEWWVAQEGQNDTLSKWHIAL